nr:portal protein [Reyranella sp.]
MAAQSASPSPSSSSRSASDLKDPWLRNYFTNRLAALDRERASYVPTWRDLSANFAPRRGRFLDGAPDASRGRRRDQKLIDNTPLIAARVMASGMMAGISSPARPWFRLRLSSERANEDPGARAWLDEVQQRMLRVFARSNLYNCLHTLYGELGVFGTGALWVDEDEEDVVRGYTLTAGEYWLSNSNRLAVDTLYRSMWWTVRQIVDTFGRDAVSAGLRAAYDSGQLDLEYEIVHAIEPNPNAAGPKIRGAHNPWNGHLSARLPWRSVWFERSAQGENLLLRVSGYQEFPCMAPRWDVVGTDSWGTGPGWIALGDSQQLQVQQKRKLEAIDKQVKPPMVGPPSLKNEPASLLPGGVTYVADPNGQSFRPAIDVRLDLSHLAQDIAEVQGRVKEAFYANLFLMLAESDRREITAREIDERREEKMLMLGPVLERLHDELLSPLVARVFNIMARNGRIPEPPRGLDGRGLQVEFISILAQAQKSVATAGIERMWQFGAQIGALKPEALDRLDADGTMDAYADMTGAPASVLVRQSGQDCQPDRCRRRPERRRRPARPGCSGHGRRAMSAEFVIPHWMAPAEPPPRPDVTDVDPYRVEELVNRFIAAKQDALFTGRDAYFRYKGSDAVQLLPHITNRLIDLKNEQLARPLPYYPQPSGQHDPESLIRLLTDGEHAALGERLDAHIADAMDGINRHIAVQREVSNRQTLAERHALIQRAAELEHTDDDKLAGLAEANASAALELARMNGEPEAQVAQSARSAVWRAAIRKRIANGNGPQALALFDRMQDQLTASDKLSLDTPTQVARQDQTAEQWIANQTATEGPPLQDRVTADPNLPLDTKHIIRAKVDARDSAEESKRAATLQALEDQVRAAYRAQAANPGAYKPGTFARLADAYTAAGDLERANGARRAAEWESFMLPFAQASAEKQQRMLDALPPGAMRDHATGLRDLQTHLFSLDAFAAGTAVYKEVGPPVPIDDLEGRVRQARQIAQLRGSIPVAPFTADEIAGMERTFARGSEKEKQAVQARLAGLPDDMRAMVKARLAPPSIDTPATGASSTMRVDAAPWTAMDELSGVGTDGPPAEVAATRTEGTGGFGGAPQSGPDPGSAAYQAADAEARRIVAEQAKAPNEGGAATSGGQIGSFATEPAPGSDVYRIAEAKARTEQVKERVTTDRAVSEWLAKARPGQSMPSALVERLSPDQKRQIEDLASGSDAIKTDPAVLNTIVNGLKSRNPETQREWAQTPLYRYRSQLSASDFRKVAELQADLDPDSGYSRSEVARIRKQLADRPDTSDLDGFYQALAPDPDVAYGEILPIGVDRNGKTRWFVLPESTRRFLKGFLDLLKGTKTGELTPEAIETFTDITGGVGHAFGPRGDGVTFGAGGTRRPLSDAEKQRARAQLDKNKAAGREQEEKMDRYFARDPDLIVGRHITVQPEGGPPTVMDFLTYHRVTKKFGYYEGKGSETAGFTPNQTMSHPLIEEKGSVIRGRAKAEPPFVGGLKLPAEKVQVMRPKDVD